MIAAADETALWQRCKCGEAAARDKLITDNMQLVFWLARRFVGRGAEWDDLCQAGAMGLVKAVDNFCPTAGNKFSTYAVPLILGELKRLLRGNNLLHISRAYTDKAALVSKADRKLAASLGREPTIAELAAEAAMTEPELAEVLAAVQRPLYLQGIYASDVSAEPELLDGEDMWVDRLALQQAMAQIPYRLAYILRARYIKEEPQAVIAKKLGISQVQVSRLEKQALKQLKSRLQA